MAEMQIAQNKQKTGPEVTAKQLWYGHPPSSDLSLNKAIELSIQAPMPPVQNSSQVGFVLEHIKPDGSAGNKLVLVGKAVSDLEGVISLERGVDYETRKIAGKTISSPPAWIRDYVKKSTGILAEQVQGYINVPEGGASVNVIGEAQDGTLIVGYRGANYVLRNYFLVPDTYAAQVSPWNQSDFKENNSLVVGKLSSGNDHTVIDSKHKTDYKSVTITYKVKDNKEEDFEIKNLPEIDTEKYKFGIETSDEIYKDNKTGELRKYFTVKVTPIELEFSTHRLWAEHGYFVVNENGEAQSGRYGLTRGGGTQYDIIFPKKVEIAKSNNNQPENRGQAPVQSNENAASSVKELATDIDKANLARIKESVRQELDIVGKELLSYFEGGNVYRGVQSGNKSPFYAGRGLTGYFDKDGNIMSDFGPGHKNDNPIVLGEHQEGAQRLIEKLLEIAQANQSYYDKGVFVPQEFKDSVKKAHFFLFFSKQQDGLISPIVVNRGHLPDNVRIAYDGAVESAKKGLPAPYKVIVRKESRGFFGGITPTIEAEVGISGDIKFTTEGTAGASNTTLDFSLKSEIDNIRKITKAEVNNWGSYSSLRDSKNVPK